MVGGAALDGEGDDLAGAGIGLVLVLLFDLAHLDGLLVGDLGGELIDQHGLGLLHGVAGDALQHFKLGLFDLLELLLLCLDLGELFGQQLVFAVDGIGLFVQMLFLLLKTVLLLGKLGTAFLDFALILGAVFVDLFLGFHERFALLALGSLDGIVENTLGFVLGRCDLALRHTLAVHNAQHHADRQQHQSADDKANDCQNGHIKFFSFLSHSMVNFEHGGHQAPHPMSRIRMHTKPLMHITRHFILMLPTCYVKQQFTM